LNETVFDRRYTDYPIRFSFPWNKDGTEILIAEVPREHFFSQLSKIVVESAAKGFRANTVDTSASSSEPRIFRRIPNAFQIRARSE